MISIAELLDIKKHNLSKEDELFVKRYVGIVIKDLKRDYGFNEKEAFKLLEGSAFIATMNSDPEYVVNHDTGYWAQRLYERNKSFEEFRKKNDK